MQFHYMTYGQALAKDPYPGVMKLTHFGRLFHGHQTCILTLSVLCLGEKRFSLNIWIRPSTRTPAAGVMSLTILVDPSLVVITCT